MTETIPGLPIDLTTQEGLLKFMAGAGFDTTRYKNPPGPTRDIKIDSYVDPARYSRNNKWNKEKWGDPNEMVVTDNEITIIINYPVREEVRYTYTNSNGFNRYELISLICESYQKMYKEEEESMTDTTTELEERRADQGKLINRPSSDGIHGIWGHDIGDLGVGGITYYPKTKEVRLSVDS